MEIRIEPSGMQELSGIYLPVRNARAAIIMVHGLGEHIGRYEWVARFFNENGYSFIGLDLPGHGKSPGKKGHIKDFNLYDNMIDAVSDYLMEKEDSVPMVIYGHSLGGVIALRYLLAKDNISSGIITAPWLKLNYEPPKIKMLLASIVSRIWPSFIQSSGLNPRDISSDSRVVDEYISDPLVHSSISANLFFSATHNAESLLNCKDEFHTPILLMNGGSDRIMSVKGSEIIAANNTMAEIKIWEGGFHELHNEVFREKVMEYILLWLDKRL